LQLTDEWQLREMEFLDTLSESCVDEHNNRIEPFNSSKVSRYLHCLAFTSNFKSYLWYEIITFFWVIYDSH